MFQKILPAAAAIAIGAASILAACSAGSPGPDGKTALSAPESVSEALVSHSGQSANSTEGTNLILQNGRTQAATEEANAFKFTDYARSKLSPDEIPLLSSGDGAVLFFMKVTGWNPTDKYKNQEVTVLKGDTCPIVDLYRLDTGSGVKTAIAKGIPYITLAKWNPQKDRAAFSGFERLTVYDIKAKKLLLEKELGNDSVNYFGWSPDGGTIYTEHPNLPNGSILDLGGGKLEHAYETDNNLYFKGALDDSKFYATLRLQVDEKKQKESGGRLDEFETVVTDRSGTRLAGLPAGRFRDSYGNSVLQAGLENFSLLLYPDFNDPAGKIKLTEEFVYEAEFTANGFAVFITKSPDVEKNKFLLQLADFSGKITARAEISGSGLLVSPDGQTGFVNGPAMEKVDFAAFAESGGKSGISASSAALPAEDPETEDIYRTIRGSMDIYFRNDMLGDEDYASLEKYFIDTAGPDQRALSDMKLLFDDRCPGHYADFYSLDLRLLNLRIKGDRASAGIGASCRNSFGSGLGMSHALELAKVGGKWFVTGLSTFPDSAEYKKVNSILPGILKDIQSGKLFDGKLKGKDIQAGQIQFWQLSEPHLADQVQYANYCKVYLKVGAGEGSLYKLVLDKKNYRNWTPVTLDSQRLSFLF